MTESLRFPLPGAAGTLVATPWTPPPLDGEEEVEVADISWVAEGGTGYGVNMGGLQSIREAEIALSEIVRILRAGEPCGYAEAYAGAGFEAVEPRGLSHTPNPTYTRVIDGRWTAWFQPDGCETSLRLTDTGSVPHRYPDLGSLALPHGLRSVLPPRSAILERAFLAVLAARIDAGNPGYTLR
jgi:hypothetical protein